MINVLIARAKTTAEEVLREFQSTSDDLLLVDQDLKIPAPCLDEIRYSKSDKSEVLVATSSTCDMAVVASRVLATARQSFGLTILNAEFVGVIRLSQFQKEIITRCLLDMTIEDGKMHFLDRFLDKLVQEKVPLKAIDVSGTSFTRDRNSSLPDSVNDANSSIDEFDLRIKLSSRVNDDFYSVLVLRKISKKVTRLAFRLGVTPNQITIGSLAVALMAAFFFSRNSQTGNVMGAILLQISLVLDCADGELARLTRRFSAFGAWLDALTDRAKEFLVYFGLAIGLSNDQEGTWLFAIALLVLQTVRHLSDYNFKLLLELSETRKLEEWILAGDYKAVERQITKNNRSPTRYWVGKILQFPIGERWLAISLSSVIGGAKLTFAVMLTFSILSLVYVVSRRIQLSFKMITLQTDDKTFVRQMDLLGIDQCFSKRVKWAEPSLVRVLEFAFICAIVATKSTFGAAAFILLFAISFHHYDNLYRALQNERKPIWLSALGFYLGGRTLLIGVALLAGVDIAPIAWYFAIIFLGVSSIQWVLAHKQNRIQK